jgi:hypothetical protein
MVVEEHQDLALGRDFALSLNEIIKELRAGRVPLSFFLCYCIRRSMFHFEFCV